MESHQWNIARHDHPYGFGLPAFQRVGGSPTMKYGFAQELGYSGEGHFHTERSKPGVFIGCSLVN